MKNPFSIEDHRSRVRIIPQIDKMPRMIEFAGSFYGKLAVLLVNLVLLWSFFMYISWSLVILCGFLILAPLSQTLKFILTLFWTAFFGLRDNEFGIWNFGELNRANVNNQIEQLYALVGDHLFLYRLFILFVSAGLFFVLTSVIKKLHLRWFLFLFVALWVILLIVADGVPKNTVSSVYAWGLFSVVGRCFFGAIYLQIALRNSSDISTLTRLVFPLQGALLGTGNNFFKNPALLTEYDGDNSFTKRQDAAICLLKSAKLLLWTRILAFMADAINFWAFGRSVAWLPGWASINLLGWSDPVVIGFKEYNALKAPLIQLWGVVFLHSLSFIFLLCTFSGVTIAFIRMSGLYIPRDTCRPYAAKSFNDFLRRLLFYYSEILVNIFIYPIWERLRFLIHYKKLRLSLTLITAVGLCGWLTHIIFMPGYFVLSGGAKNGFHFFIMWIPYFVLLAMACAISATGFVSKILKPLVPSIVHMPMVFVFYSLILVTAHGYPLEGAIIENWQARFIFICSLFGIR